MNCNFTSKSSSIYIYRQPIYRTVSKVWSHFSLHLCRGTLIKVIRNWVPSLSEWSIGFDSNLSCWGSSVTGGLRELTHRDDSTAQWGGVKDVTWPAYLSVAQFLDFFFVCPWFVKKDKVKLLWTTAMSSNYILTIRDRVWNGATLKSLAENQKMFKY